MAMPSPKPLSMSVALAVLILAAAAVPVRAADEPYDQWERLPPEFPSTGGGGVIIKGYAPVVSGATCTTDFTAHLPDGQVHANVVEFDALATQGGTLCHNGRWRSRDGSASGTTPLRVFIKEGIARRSP